MKTDIYGLVQKLSFLRRTGMRLPSPADAEWVTRPCGACWRRRRRGGACTLLVLHPETLDFIRYELGRSDHCRAVTMTSAPAAAYMLPTAITKFISDKVGTEVVGSIF